MSRQARLVLIGAVIALTANIALAQSASLSIQKIDVPDPVEAGTNLTYTITVASEGPDDAANVALSDTLPAGTTFQSLTSPGGWSCTTPAVGAAGTVDCSIATFTPGSVDFTLVVQTDAGMVDGTVISNTANVSSTTSDPDLNDNSATADTTVQAPAPVLTLSIAITDAPDPVTAGYDVTYTLTASTTYTTAVDATLTAPVPANTTFQSFIAPGGWSCLTPAVGATGSVSCTAPTLDLGDTVFSLTVRVNGSTPGGTLLTDDATMDITSSGRPESASDSESTTVVAATVLSASKTVTGSFTAAGAIVYSIVLTNEGPGVQADNPGDELTDVLPAGLTLVSASATSGTALATIGTNTVTWNGALASGESVTIAVNATIGALANGTVISNQASLSWDGEGDGTNDAAGVSDDPGTATAGDATSFAVGAPVPATGPLALAALLALCGLVAIRRLG